MYRLRKISTDRNTFEIHYDILFFLFMFQKRVNTLSAMKMAKYVCYCFNISKLITEKQKNSYFW